MQVKLEKLEAHLHFLAIYLLIDELDVIVERELDRSRAQAYLIGLCTF